MCSRFVQRCPKGHSMDILKITALRARELRVEGIVLSHNERGKIFKAGGPWPGQSQRGAEIFSRFA